MTEVLNPTKRNMVCSKCDDSRKDQKIELRGYIGFSLIGHSQIWKRVQ